MLGSLTLSACSLLLALNAGCHSTHAQPKAAAPPHPQTPAVRLAPPTPLDVKAEELGGPAWDKRWDVFIEKNLPPALLSRQVPHDVERYCPAFYRMSETSYWATLQPGTGSFRIFAKQMTNLPLACEVPHKLARR